MKRSTIYLLILFVILLIVSYFFFSPGVERTASYSLKDLNLVIDSALVNKIEIKKGEQSVTLEKVIDKWNLTSPIEYPADKSAVEALLSSAAKFKVHSLISSNPEKQALFQVDTASGIFINFLDQKGKSISLIVGKMGPSYMESYIRPVSSENVYLAEGINSWIVNKEIRDWREKLILPLQKEFINQVKFVYSKESLTIKQIEGQWYMESDSATANSIDNFLSTLSNFRTENFVDSEVELTTPQVDIAIEAEKTYAIRLHPIQPDSNRYWVTTSETRQIFEVSKYTAQQLLKQKEDFKK